MLKEKPETLFILNTVNAVVAFSSAALQSVLIPSVFLFPDQEEAARCGRLS